MPRKPRFNLPGIPQHVIQRGNNRDPCFFAEADYFCYLDALARALERGECKIHAYVLMTNHVHLLVTPHSAHGISQLMQDVGRRYVQYVNQTYQRSGTLWEGRFKGSLVDSEAYLLTCMRYIELNPVRAGMVEHPGEYRWSSYACNARGREDSVVSAHPLYVALGSDPDERRHAYRELFRHHLDPGLLHELREALNRELVLGREDFKDKIEKTAGRQARRGKDGRPRVEDEPGGDVVSGEPLLY